MKEHDPALDFAVDNPGVISHISGKEEVATLFLGGVRQIDIAYASEELGDYVVSEVYEQNNDTIQKSELFDDYENALDKFKKLVPEYEERDHAIVDDDGNAESYETPDQF